MAWLFSLEAGAANLVALRYRSFLGDRGLSAATVARRLAALRSLGQLARQLGACAWTLEVAGPSVEILRDTAGPGAEGWARMSAVAGADATPRGLRDRAIVMMSRNMGLRRNEVASLDLEHIDIEGGVPVAAWVLGKGKSDRKRITIPPRTGEALAAWLAARGPRGGAVFFRTDHGAEAARDRGRLTGQAIADLVARLGRLAGIGRKVNHHSLRHEGITQAWVATRDVEDVMEFARHANYNTTRKYIDNSRDRAGRVAELIEGE